MLSSPYIVGSAITLCGILLSGISQILLKVSAAREHKSRLHEYLNPWVITSYGILAVTTVMSVIALRFIPLSLSTALGATGQVFVPLMGYFILGESLTKRKILGIIVVMLGVVIFAI